MTAISQHNSLPYLAYQAFKYVIYSLLVVNLFLFLQENYAAAAHTFANGIPPGQIIEAYSDSIDTASWVLLLLLFELETYVISDKYLTRRLTIGLFAVRSLAYLFILYSLYGYFSRYLSVLSVEPFTGDACALVGSDFTRIITLNEYVPITLEDCAALQGPDLVKLTGTQIIGTIDEYQVINNLALVDVINASTWVLIVAILEVDVFVQSRHTIDHPFIRISNSIKLVLYSTLLACAIYWWIDGDFLDFWDAFLWLIAFVFIEMNIFEWQKEIAQNKKEVSAA
ncbi:hypothetical protein [Simiduia agarivorans]|uniref:Shikimate kinase n=1 Tax=Simiduia agarivorans (strain DSM 21679 / JCM 13881 / BCRC 17597 / SA1) TaxID=1117647 RepID=K4KIS0_SIMAS|nr:hypothetical protein [Simiduia agarivorans]AFU97868.1 hypothetical protein M5M_03285 [Simiduia agarivorans SA1 = DSM 21679]